MTSLYLCAYCPSEFVAPMEHPGRVPTCPVCGSEKMFSPVDRLLSARSQATGRGGANTIRNVEIHGKGIGLYISGGSVRAEGTLNISGVEKAIVLRRGASLDAETLNVKSKQKKRRA